MTYFIGNAKAGVSIHLAETDGAWFYTPAMRRAGSIDVHRPRGPFWTWEEAVRDAVDFASSFCATCGVAIDGHLHWVLRPDEARLAEFQAG